MKKITIAALVAFSLWTMPANADTQQKDTLKTELQQVEVKKKKSFLQKLTSSGPIGWIGRNWTAYDPEYSVPSFYNWVIQLQDNVSKEYLYMRTLDGDRVKMHSRTSNNLGPYLGYRWLGYGLSVDVNAMLSKEKGRKKNEFTLSINSNLFNIDIIRRRTGGDFVFDEFKVCNFNNTGEDTEIYDFTKYARQYDMGSLVNASLTGVNINHFLNHKKYSNPAAFSNGAIQLRSAGSFIVGAGFTNQVLDNTISEVSLDMIDDNLIKNVPSDVFADVAQDMGYSSAKEMKTKMDEIYYNDRDQFFSKFGKLLRDQRLYPYLYNNESAIENVGFMINQTPSHIRINDLHIQMGYAYNLVFSRRLLFGLSVIAAPSLKWINYNNYESISGRCAEDIAAGLNEAWGLDEFLDEYTFHGSDFRYSTNETHLGLNFYGRASLTYNYNRWRAGFNLNYNSYMYKNGDVRINDFYGNCNIYVGYCFGRKKEYRWNGKDRQAYIMAALSKKDIEEMHDTMPKGNLPLPGAPVMLKSKHTKYKTDEFNLNIYGSDLCLGPDGKYGEYTIKDGYVSPDQDSEHRLAAGRTLDVDKSGSIRVTAGHQGSFRAGNWWKSHLSVNQNPMNWYPEMLHYVLKGDLTFWLRDPSFGTSEPVKVTIPDFYINHGHETKDFFQVGADGMESHSAYSIVGNFPVNGRMCRVYIESKKMGRKLNVYINPLKKSTTEWMAKIEDSRPVSFVSIPATHDAGTASLPEGSLTSQAHTQNFTIGEQLYDGIRAFDIRLKKNMKFGHTLECRESFRDCMKEVEAFLKKHPSEFLVMMIGSDEGGKWSDEMKVNYMQIIRQYQHLFVENFENSMPVADARGKILVIRRQEACPYGKLLKFADNAVFDNNGFYVEDVYKQHKTYKKIKLVEEHLRNAYENEDPNKWYITFNSIAWDPRHHKPYYSAWGAVNVRKPMNKSLREVLEKKGYSRFGMVFLDFYSDHGDNNILVERIINSNFTLEEDNDYLTAGEM